MTTDVQFVQILKGNFSGQLSSSQTSNCSKVGNNNAASQSNLRV